ncbi:hypothetical protein BH10ACT1_BH10ACT1_18580 [soil metagenome]
MGLASLGGASTRVIAAVTGRNRATVARMLERLPAG